jgi:hypothetical protein
MYRKRSTFEQRRLTRRWQVLPVALVVAAVTSAGSAAADTPGSPLNPIPLPGMQVSTARRLPAANHTRDLGRPGAFDARIYALPTATLPTGADLALAHDGATANASEVTGHDAYAANGLELGIEPRWDVEVEDQFVRLDNDTNPGAWARTRGEHWGTAFGLEVRF